MAIPTRAQPEKNIWVAAGDGDLDRVRELVEQYSLSPNVPDPNTYTPMHAAASYGQLHILGYLISRGGDVNVIDDDGDTPLYVVENIETARFLVDHGALVQRANNEGISPIEYLSEDFPEVSAYLSSLPSASATTTTTRGSTTSGPAAAAAAQTPSQHAQNQISEQLTSSLLQNVQGIMQRAEEEGREPDEEELREAVGKTVLEGMVTGYGMRSLENRDRRRDGGGGGGDDDDVADGSEAKRPRMDGTS